MKYIYGPVRSRRLGLSLGISLTPHKTCNLDCVYCQLGPTRAYAHEVREYIPIAEVLEEIQLWLRNNPELAKKIDFLTLSGCGEPTLNAGAGKLITAAKQISGVPVCVITNATTIGIPGIRRAIESADVIVPSLDAADTAVFGRINRPHEGVRLEAIIEGLENLRKEYRGRIWLEVMIVKGINDDLSHARKLKELIDRIRPDRIQINTPVRSTAEKDILPADSQRLEQIKEIFGDKAEIF